MKRKKSTHSLDMAKSLRGKCVFSCWYLEFYLPKFINSLEFTADEENKFYQKGKAILDDG